MNYPQTLCFMRRDNELLLLNRIAPPALGLWNGVGGKAKPGESSNDCVIREVYEETGICISGLEIRNRGVVTWEVDESHTGGMHVFLVDIPKEYVFKTPVGTEEGILDWKPISWVLTAKNYGVGEMIPRYLPFILDDYGAMNYHCVLSHDKLVRFERTDLT